jgi:hypothetical protein
MWGLAAVGVAILVALILRPSRFSRLPPPENDDMERRNAERFGNYPTEGIGGPT